MKWIAKLIQRCNRDFDSRYFLICGQLCLYALVIQYIFDKKLGTAILDYVIPSSLFSYYMGKHDTLRKFDKE